MMPGSDPGAVGGHTPCPKGYHRDPQRLNECYPDDASTPCPGGAVRGADGKCPQGTAAPCPPGQHVDLTSPNGLCVDDPPAGGGTPCEPPQAGHHKDEAGNCVPDPGPPGTGGGQHGCQSWETWDETQKKCVSPISQPGAANSGGIYDFAQQLLSGARTPAEQAQAYAYIQKAFGGPGANQQAAMGAYYNQMQNPMTPLDMEALKGYGNMYYNASPGEAGAFNAYNSMIGSGYSPAEQQAMFQKGTQGVLGQQDVARRQAMGLAQRTGNTSGLFGAMAGLGAQSADQLGSFARQNVIDQANEKQRRTLAGAQGLNTVAGTSLARQTAGLGGATGMLNEANRRTMQGANQIQSADEQQYAREMAALQGLGGYNAGIRGTQQQGLGALLALYNSQVGQGMHYDDLIARLMMLPTGQNQIGAQTHG